MSAEFAIRVERLGKMYRIRHQGTAHRYTALRDVIADKAKSLFRLRSAEDKAKGSTSRTVREDFWALKDVSFEVKQGEAVGIIGRNGAGKSTILKILSRITAPTEGRVVLHGRVSSLLEVGTGFHPELTGRENIFLNGAILGMSRSEIKEKFDEIVAFAEVERFLDTPVKRYSSGMYVRLAFAIAAHLEPEILIVDEVLAVGDAQFQQKCLGKMEEVSKGGRTVLFVSHNMETVSQLTTRAVLLADGSIAAIGPTREIVVQYLHRGGQAELVYQKSSIPAEPAILRVALKTCMPQNIQIHGENMTVSARVSVPMAMNGGRFEICACDERLHRIFHVWHYDSPENRIFREPGRYDVTCVIPKLRLYAGKYTLLIHLAEKSGGRIFEKLDGICPFEVIMSGTRDGGWLPGEGAYIEDAEWHVSAAGKDGPWAA